MLNGGLLISRKSMCQNTGKETFMKKEIGLWIDHRKAVVVMVSDEGEEVKEITSHMEKRVRFASGDSEDGSSEDVRDRQYGNRLNSYYDAVIAVIRDGDSIQIFGPVCVKHTKNCSFTVWQLSNQFFVCFTHTGPNSGDQFTSREDHF